MDQEPVSEDTPAGGPDPGMTDAPPVSEDAPGSDGMTDVAGPSGGCAPVTVVGGTCKLTIQVPNLRETLYFWGHAEVWEDVKRWISTETNIPTAQFHLMRAWTGEKLKNDDPIPFGAVTICEGVPSWMTITVVLKAW